MDELEREAKIEQEIEDAGEDNMREAFMAQFGEDPEDVLGANWASRIKALEL